MSNARTAKRAARPATLIACYIATILLASCKPAVGPESKQASVAPCVPAADTAAARPARETTVARIYIDRSQSMSGYVHPVLGRSQALADLLRLFERNLPAVAATNEYHAFGAQISDPLGGDELPSFSTPAAYNCRGCDNQESHIDEVLDRISRSNANELNMVITDLWLDNRSFRGSDEVALGEPLRTILRSGRSIGLVGIRAAFRGPIYDVPGAGTYRDAQERPLFLLMVGPAETLAQIQRQLAESGSPALSADRLRFSLFSAGAFYPAREAGLTPRGRGVGPATILRSPSQRETPQFRMNLEHAEARGGAIMGASTAEPRLGGAVWEGEPFEQTRVWQLQNESTLSSCAPGTWAELPAIRGAWRPAGGPGRFGFGIDHRIGTRLPAPGTYYLLAELGVTGVSAPNPGTAWMEEWSLAPDQAASFVSQRPSVFRTLNLGRLRNILDEDLKRQNAGRTRITRRFGFLLRLEQ